MAENDTGRETPPNYAQGDDVKTAGESIADFLLQLEDYVPTVNHFL